MPIYRVPEVSSSLKLHNRHGHQNGHHLQRSQQQQQHQEILEEMRLDTADDDDTMIRRSQSMPIHVAPMNEISPTEESIVEREIRLQLEREAEIVSLHDELRNARPSNSISSPEEDVSPKSTLDKTRQQPAHPVAAETAAAAAAAAEMPQNEAVTPFDADDGRRIISQYSRVGESMIVKELLEQKRREEELRNHWRDIGLLTKETSVNGKGPLKGDVNSSSRRTGADDASMDGTDAAPFLSIPSITVLKAQPFGEAEANVSNAETYIRPQLETVIEREIRLARQREGSLRRARGYPLSRDDQLREVEINPRGFAEVINEQTTTTSSSTATINKGSREVDLTSMRRLATNRLKQEILKERQRELDVRKQGQIYTISEERFDLEPKRPPKSQRSSDPADRSAKKKKVPTATLR